MRDAQVWNTCGVDEVWYSKDEDMDKGWNADELDVGTALADVWMDIDLIVGEDKVWWTGRDKLW